MQAVSKCSVDSARHRQIQANWTHPEIHYPLALLPPHRLKHYHPGTISPAPPHLPPPLYPNTYCHHQISKPSGLWSNCCVPAAQDREKIELRAHWKSIMTFIFSASSCVRSTSILSPDRAGRNGPALTAMTLWSYASLDMNCQLIMPCSSSSPSPIEYLGFWCCFFFFFLAGFLIIHRNWRCKVDDDFPCVIPRQKNAKNHLAHQSCICGLNESIFQAASEQPIYHPSRSGKLIPRVGWSRRSAQSIKRALMVKFLVSN